jgi:uncharacterized membrane protein YheB (UPF0754 family)
LDTVLQFLQTYWVYLTIPVVSAVVGFGTNWLAVKMMMAPLDFVGIGPFGWQGVIPGSARNMAKALVENSVAKVLTQEELASRIDADEMIEALQHRIDPLIEDIVDEVMAETTNYGLKLNRFVWTASPAWIKEKVYQEVHKNLPGVIENAVDEIKDNLDDLVDLNQVIMDKLISHKELLVEIFDNAADKEFVFLARSGFYFGLPLGLPVMVLWYFFPVWWLLPVAGLLVGYLTNKLAIYMLQKPLTPVKLGPITIQGLFVRRQSEVSLYYANVFASKLITAETLAQEVLKNSKSADLLFDIIQREVNNALEKSRGTLKTLMVFSVGPAEYAKMRQIISDKAFAELNRPDKRSFRFIDQALDIENTLAERVGGMAPEEFFELLHPVVEEDEWKLMAVGAVLGFGAGICQWLLLT